MVISSKEKQFLESNDAGIAFIYPWALLLQLLAVLHIILNIVNASNAVTSTSSASLGVDE